MMVQFIPLLMLGIQWISMKRTMGSQSWKPLGCSLFLSVFTWPLYCVYRPCHLSLYPNTARPSGKLASWALTIQEMDLTIKIKAGKRYTNADALSRCLVKESSQGKLYCYG